MITRNIEVPTGNICVMQGEKGKLEFLSIGDYGKDSNIKANFLGITRELNGVPNGEIMPLNKKWVITISTQYGCSMNCKFCDVPKVGKGVNATSKDMLNQIFLGLNLHPEIKGTERLNIHFARMGEPIFNKAVFEFSIWLIENKRKFQEETGLRVEVIHPVLTTSLPRKFKNLEETIMNWCDVKNNLYKGQAGLQFSINSTNELQRTEMYQGLQTTLRDLSKIAEKMPEPLGRKYCLNFAFSTDFIIDARKLKQLFDPNKFMCKITPIHNNNACRENGIETVGGYDSWKPYSQVEKNLKNEGFDVLVFVPSIDEEDGLVTCGNLVLGGGENTVKDNTLRIRGL